MSIKMKIFNGQAIKSETNPLHTQKCININKKSLSKRYSIRVLMFFVNKLNSKFFMKVENKYFYCHQVTHKNKSSFKNYLKIFK